MPGLKKRMTSAIGAAALFLCVFLVMPASGLAESFKNIVAFGDSLSDHGGLQTYIGAYDPILNPTGAPDTWSNGDTWVEYLAGNWDAVLDNNAIGGAMTKGHESNVVQALSDAGTFPQLGLVGQVNLYIAEYPEISSDETLYSIWIGANDLLKYGRGESSATSPTELITNAMTNIQTAITALYAQGATNFLVLNLPDIGATPLYVNRSAEEIAGATLLSASFNDALKTLIETLPANMPGSTFYFYDVFTAMNTFMANNTFENQTGTYMELDANGNRTGNTNGDAEDYMFWDSVHPTTAAHELVADTVGEEVFDNNANDGTDPLPSICIKVNGSNSFDTVSENDDVNITVSLAPNAQDGELADWWVYALTPYGTYYFDSIDGTWGWLPGQSTSYEGALKTIQDNEILNAKGFVPGTYTFYFEVDLTPNGIKDESAYSATASIEVSE